MKHPKPTAVAEAAAERIFWPADLAHRYGKDRTTIWRWRQDGKLPRPDVRIGTQEGWRSCTIIAHESLLPEQSAA